MNSCNLWRQNVGVADNELNIWTGFKAQLVDNVDMSLVNPWLDHIHQVWADGDDAIYYWMLCNADRHAQHGWRPAGNTPGTQLGRPMRRFVPIPPSGSRLAVPYSFNETTAGAGNGSVLVMECVMARTSD